MLASPEQTAAEVWKRVQESARAPVTSLMDAGAHETTEVWIEDKYDGVRCQLHKVAQRVALYSRDLKDITATFPEIAEEMRKLPQDFILDGEVIAMQADTVLPFSELQKRLGRRQEDLFMREEVPIAFVAFDCLWLNGTSLLNSPLVQRRASLEALGPRPLGFRLAQLTRIRSVTEIEEAFTAARTRGNEGLMIKLTAGTRRVEGGWPGSS